MNHTIRLKCAADRPRLDALVENVARHDLIVEALDGPAGALGLPLWTSVVISAEHGDPAELEAAVWLRLAEAGVDEHFERWN